jgi:hypothetical protein
MAFDWESLGGGGVMGFVATALTLLGWNRRIAKLEAEKKDIAVCEKEMNSVECDRSSLQEDIKYIRSRVDKLYDFQINGKSHG